MNRFVMVWGCSLVLICAAIANKESWFAFLFFMAASVTLNVALATFIMGRPGRGALGRQPNDP